MQRYNVLFLCTGNSARSIMVEAIMNKKGFPKFTAYSAGSHATGRVHSQALRQLEIAKLPTQGLHSKNLDEFATPGAPELHFVLTVCDNTAKEVCPIWPGQPMTAHWGVPDPAAVSGSLEQIERAFRDAFMTLERRISFLFVPTAFWPRQTSHSEENRRHWPPMKPLRARIASEFLGTGFLVAAVLGSGIMGERLAAGNVAIALLANTIATGAALVALILTFGPISGAHFNPVVTLADAWEGGIPWAETSHYVLAQIFGGIGGAIVAHLMFGLPIVSLSQHARLGLSQWFSEFVATFGLLSVIWGCSRTRPSAVPFAVGAYITAAYWFTASTSFANPAVTIARCLSDTFAGIRPIDVPWFVFAQFLGGFTATLVFRWLVPNLQVRAKDVLLAHDVEQNRG